MSRTLYRDDEELYTDEASDLHQEVIQLLRPFVMRIANNDINLNDTKIVMGNALHEVINDMVYQRNRQRREEQMRLDPPVMRARPAGVRMATVGGEIPAPLENADIEGAAARRHELTRLANLDFDDLGYEPEEDPD